MLATACKLGFRPYEYEARLALAEIELMVWISIRGCPPESLKADARAHQLLLIANQAQELSQTSKTP